MFLLHHKTEATETFEQFLADAQSPGAVEWVLPDLLWFLLRGSLYPPPPPNIEFDNRDTVRGLGLYLLNKTLKHEWAKAFPPYSGLAV